MANWYGSARSNYVRFKDSEQAYQLINDFGGLEIIKDSKHRVGFMSATEDGGWPQSENEEPIDSLCEKLRKIMHKNEVLILMQTGSEKMRYLTGNVCAFPQKGKVRSIDLSDIYKKFPGCTTCEY